MSYAMENTIIEQSNGNGGTYTKLVDQHTEAAVNALAILSRLGLINWRPATLEEDSLEIDQIGELNIVAHDGWCMSPYLQVNGVFIDVGKRGVRRAWGTIYA